MPAIQIAMLADIPEGVGRAFEVAGRRVAVFRAEDVLYAIDDTCSHAEASLSEGEFDADELCIECPLHGAIFDVRTGVPRTLPAFEPVASYRVFAEGEAVFLEYPE
jgi:3-phenylpropionate/trans-cinnamate dioxygenase ferredoxin component